MYLTWEPFTQFYLSENRNNYPHSGMKYNTDGSLKQPSCRFAQLYGQKCKGRCHPQLDYSTQRAIGNSKICKGRWRGTKRWEKHRQNCSGPTEAKHLPCWVYGQPANLRPRYALNWKSNPRASGPKAQEELQFIKQTGSLLVYMAWRNHRGLRATEDTKSPNAARQMHMKTTMHYYFFHRVFQKVAKDS